MHWTGFIRAAVIRGMYYLGKNGQQTGPFTQEQLQAMVTNGQLAPSDLLWTEGMSEWKPASTVLPALFPPQPQGAAPIPPLSQPTPGTAHPVGPVPNYLWQSIAVTLCCCLPFGIVAIVYAAQVNTKLSVGDVAGAHESSKKAKMWCWISFGVGIVVNIAVGIIEFVVAVSQRQ